MSWWLVRYDRHGPAAFVSHLDTTRALQRTFARAGVVLALSRGMRPKPRISIVVPLPVGAAAQDELVVVEVDDEKTALSAGEALPALRAATAGGLDVRSLTVVEQRPRPVAVAASYRCRVDLDPAAAAAAAAELTAADSAVVERRSPKGTRSIDLKEYLTRIEAAALGDGAVVEFDLALTAAGTARPAEVVGELARRAGGTTPLRDLVRTAVRYREPPRGTRAGPGATGNACA